MIGIHKEGYRIVAVISIIMFICAVFLTVFLINRIWILLPLLLTIIMFILFIMRFFRVPERKTEFREGILYSPADGKIVAIEETFEDEFFKEKRIQISIFMSVWDVHINYFPLKGQVIHYKYHPGRFLIARNPKSSTLNERTTIVIESEKKYKILIRQIAGIIARRIICYANTGSTFNIGEELGFIKFGSRVDVFLPLQSKIMVKMDDQVYGKITPLAII